MIFENPQFFLLFILLAIIIVSRKVFFSKNDSRLLFSDFTNLKVFFGKAGKIKILFIHFIFFLMISLIIIALARPTQPFTEEKIEVDSIDILLVLDISSSMLAEDFKPNRIEAVKLSAKEFINNRKTDRIGLLVFGKETFIQCPLTIDYNVLNSLLDEITVIDPEFDGTAIGIALASGINRLRSSISKSKVIILLSDGSNNAGSIDPIAAAKIAKENNIKVYTIGAGTNQAVTRIPGRGLIKNEIDEDTLKNIANETGGKYFRATNKNSLNEIYSQINNLEKTSVEIEYFSSQRELYIFFLIPAFLLLVLFEILNLIYFKRIK
jgi:Ca-activated chloride channel family protein